MQDTVRIALDMVLHDLKSWANITIAKILLNGSVQNLKIFIRLYAKLATKLDLETSGILRTSIAPSMKEFIRRLHNIAEEIRAEDTVIPYCFLSMKCVITTKDTNLKKQKQNGIRCCIVGRMLLTVVYAITSLRIPNMGCIILTDVFIIVTVSCRCNNGVI